MSSVVIAEQIASCRVQIDECTKEIGRLEREIEELEKALRIGDTAREGLMASLTARKSRIESTDTLQKYALTGNKYIGGMKDDLTNTKTINLISEFEEKRSTLKKEILNTDDDLENKRNELSRLNGTLNNLEVQYQNALNQEAWEREQERIRNQEEWDRKMNANK